MLTGFSSLDIRFYSSLKDLVDEFDLISKLWFISMFYYQGHRGLLCKMFEPKSPCICNYGKRRRMMEHEVYTAIHAARLITGFLYNLVHSGGFIGQLERLT